MIAGILAFLTALPKILDLMNRLGIWMTQNNVQKWMSDLEVQIDALESAKTAEDKLKAASGVLDSMRGLGK